MDSFSRRQQSKQTMIQMGDGERKTESQRFRVWRFEAEETGLYSKDAKGQAMGAGGWRLNA